MVETILVIKIILLKRKQHKFVCAITLISSIFVFVFFTPLSVVIFSFNAQ